MKSVECVVLRRQCPETGDAVQIELTFIHPPKTVGYKHDSIRCDAGRCLFCPKDYQCPIIDEISTNPYAYL